MAAYLFDEISFGKGQEHPAIGTIALTFCFHSYCKNNPPNSFVFSDLLYKINKEDRCHVHVHGAVSGDISETSAHAERCSADSSSRSQSVPARASSYKEVALAPYRFPCQIQSAGFHLFDP